MNIISKIFVSMVLSVTFCLVLSTTGTAFGMAPDGTTSVQSVTYAEVRRLSGSTGETSLLDDVSTVGSNLYEMLPGLANRAKDKGGELIDKAKEKVPELVDKVKETAPEVVATIRDGAVDARDKFAEWNAAQEEEFWAYTDGMLAGGASNEPVEAGDISPDAEPDPPCGVTPEMIERAQRQDGMYYYDPERETTEENAEVADATEEIPATSVPGTSADTIEVGDGYIVVGGERYEKVETTDVSGDATNEDIAAIDDAKPKSFLARLWESHLRIVEWKTKRLVYVLPFVLVAALIAYFWGRRDGRKR